MKALITGASGAVGSALTEYLHGRGDTVTAWPRHDVPPDNPAAIEAYLRAEKPDALFHLATASQPTGRDNEGWLVNVEWTGQLARLCAALDIRFLFTSSVMVFTDDAPGPFTPDSPPDAREGYGYEKRQAELRALEQNPAAIVARLGWQIGERPGSNNMLDFLSRQTEIRASQRWYPACSFLRDTAAALVALVERGEGGLYLVDSNTGWTFYEIASALNALHGGSWHVVADDAFVYDQRMLDPRVPIPALRERLPALRPL